MSIKPYRTKWLDPDYRRDYPSQPGDLICARCQRVVDPARARWVHLVDGAPNVLHPKDEPKYTSDDGDMYTFPIGPDCAKRLGLEWTSEVEERRDI